MNKPAVRFTLIAILFAYLPGVGAAIRLAVVPESNLVKPAADLVTVALSAQDQVQLVERAELDKVMGEQAVAAGSRDYLKLGQILGADGVLLLGVTGLDTNQVLNLRLMAVKPGVVLRQISTPWPPVDLPAWSTELAQQLKPLWPKLAVLKKDAVPISILNLRAAVRTTESELLERELTTLLHNRLMQQPEVFVLERRRMELLTAEKEFNGEASAFWNGGYLLEGLINKERYDRDVVTISGQLFPPDKQAVTKIELTGQRTNLPALIDELSRRVLAGVKAGMALPEWNPAAEAAQYLTEAQWASRWRMWREAQAASEASWALGRQTKEVAELRIKAWRQTGLDQAACNFEPLGLRVFFSAPPDAERFADLLRAGALFESGWLQFVAGDPKLDTAWLELGNALVADISAWLRQYYFTPEARVGQEQHIVTAKQQADRMCQMMASHPDYPNADPKQSLAVTRALWGSLWVETPEQGLQTYREILQSGNWPAVRKRFVNSFCFAQEDSVRQESGWPEGFYDPASPLLTGWKWDDRQRWTQVWEGFVDQQCASTNPLVALEGRYLRCSFAWSGEDYERELRELLQSVLQQRDALANENLLEAWLVDLRRLIGKGVAGEPLPNRLAALSSGRRQRIGKEVWPEFEKKFADFAKVQQGQEKRQQFMADARNYFITRNDYDFGSFVRWLPEKFSPAEASELLPVVQDYKARLSKLPPGTLRGPWSNSITQLETKLQTIAAGIPTTKASPATTTNRIPATAGPVGGRRPAGMPFGSENVAPPIDLETVVATNFLRGAKFWRPDRQQFRAKQIDKLTISDVVYREGRLWAEVLFVEIDPTDYGRTDRVVICAIDPATLATEMIPVEVDQGRLPGATFAQAGDRHFEVYRNALYFNVGGKLRRCLLKQRQWEDVPVPVEGNVRLELVQDRLYARSSDSILRLNPTGDGAEVVASTRRRPAQNALDQLEKLGRATVFSGPTGAVCVAIDNRVWSCATVKGDWELMTEFPAAIMHYASAGIFYRKMPDGQEEEYYIWFPGQRTPELGLTQPLDPKSRRPGGFPMRLNRSPEPTAPPPARWELPARLRPVGEVITLSSNQLWSFVGSIAIQSDQGAPMLKETNGRQGLLFGFDYHRKAPVVIPLKLEAPRDLASGQELRSLVSAGTYGTRLLSVAPAGLLLMHQKLPGFWLLPEAELNRQAREWQENPPIVSYPATANLNVNPSRP